MPIHDWSNVDANLFHDFHQAWAMQIRNTLNSELLPEGYSALVEQHTAGLVPDVLTVERKPKKQPPTSNGNLLTTEQPHTRFNVKLKEERLAKRTNRIAIHHGLGKVVCIIEIVSPGNKAGRAAFRSFLQKTHEFLDGGVNMLIVDLFPPTPRDPRGIHKAIWDEYDPDEPFELPADKQLTLVSYVAAEPFADQSLEAMIEPVAVGDVLPKMPAYLEPGNYVSIPLEETYQAAWLTCPKDMRYLVEHGRLPDEE